MRFLLPSAFRSLRHRNFRLFFFGQSISLVGTWMQMVAQPWLVYRLTHSAFWLGFTGFLGAFPVFAFGLLGGSLADHVSRYRIVIWTQILFCVEALILAILVLTGQVQVWQIALLAFAAGLITAFDMPARQAFFVEMVEGHDLANAIALNSSIVNMARLIGPALAGLLMAVWGEGICFLLNALSFLAVLAALAAMRFDEKEEKKKALVWIDHLREGIVYAWEHGSIRALLLLLGLASVTAMASTVLVPIIVRDHLGLGARGFGWLMAASGLGALLGAMALAVRKTTRGLGKYIAGSCVLMSVSLIGFALTRSAWLSALFLTSMGLGMIVQIAGTNTSLQNIVREDFRGRIMSLFTITFIGLAPFGNLVLGILAERIGAPRTMILASLCTILGAVGFYRALPRLRRITLERLDPTSILWRQLHP